VTPATEIVTQRHAQIRYLQLIAARSLEELGRRHRIVCEAYFPDALHDLRVAARRARALLDLMMPAVPRGAGRKAYKSVRRILRATRAARDADVQLAAVSKRLVRIEQGAERAGLEHLVSKLESRAQRHRKRTLAKLEEQDFADVVSNVTAAVERGVHRLEQHGGSAWPGFVHAAMHASLDGALVPVPEVDDETAVQRLHAMRISTKRLRYTLDLLRPVLNDGPAAVFDSLKRVQRLLGDHHDLALLAQRIQRELRVLEQAGCTLLIEGVEGEVARIGRERRKIFQQLRHAFVTDERAALRGRIEAVLPQTGAPTATGPGLTIARMVAPLHAIGESG
jgi:CHAD domain-containing protein